MAEYIKTNTKNKVGIKLVLEQLLRKQKSRAIAESLNLICIGL